MKERKMGQCHSNITRVVSHAKRKATGIGICCNMKAEETEISDNLVVMCMHGPGLRHKCSVFLVPVYVSNVARPFHTRRTCPSCTYDMIWRIGTKQGRAATFRNSTAGHNS